MQGIKGSTDWKLRWEPSPNRLKRYQRFNCHVDVDRQTFNPEIQRRGRWSISATPGRDAHYILRFNAEIVTRKETIVECKQYAEDHTL